MAKFEKIDLGLKEAYEELFMTDKGREEFRAPKVIDIEISKIDDFENHPFNVKDDEEMTKLMESIAQHGVLSPVVVRPKTYGDDGFPERYERISGHRRMFACKKLGLEKIPSISRELSKEEAIITMADSNMYRENILPSEKARVYKMKLEALNSQGKRTDLTSTPLVSKSIAGFRTNELVGSTNNESREQVRRYIRLNYLIPELLQMADENKIAFRPAVELSYLTEKEQYQLLEIMEVEDCTPSLTQSQKFKELSRNGKLTTEKMSEILSQPKANQKEKISFSADELRQYFPKSYTDNEIKEKMVCLAAQYKARLDRNRDAR